MIMKIIQIIEMVGGPWPGALLGLSSDGRVFRYDILTKKWALAAPALLE